MDIIIESTKAFEKDIAKLGKDERDLVIDKINDCASLFPNNKAAIYRKMHRPHNLLLINGYESSLYTLLVTRKLRVILTVDEDPIFDRTIFTLFRIVHHDQLDKAYRSIAESLHQELLDLERQPAQIS